MNLQPSEAEAGFDIRVPPLGDIDDLQRRIDEDWAPASRNFTYSVMTANNRVLNLLTYFISDVLMVAY